MKALVVETPGVARVKEVPYPQPGAGEVTIKVERTGICGTDIHIYHGEFAPKFPIIPGHEFSGVVHEIGEQVTEFKVGDRVTVDPSIFCGGCLYCLTQRGNHCSNWGAIGVTVDGGMAEFVKSPAQNVIKLADHVSFEEGAFIEPVACVVHGLNRLQMEYGSRVLIYGGGAMGQQLVQCLIKAGASEIVVVDISEEKLALALKFGASKGVHSRDAEKLLATPAYAEGFDVVVDATGIASVIQQAITHLGPAGKYLQFGVASEKSVIQLSPYDLYRRDWTFIGSMAINHTFVPASRWITEGRIDVKPLVSKLISLEEAVSFLEGPRDPDLFKVQIRL
ncbi:alcohol dehydrogenase [Paenibacillaceae bacterium]|nr:alcohol dehydrogenase [Paenibacillaceae bacterium]